MKFKYGFYYSETYQTIYHIEKDKVTIMFAGQLMELKFDDPFVSKELWIGHAQQRSIRLS